MITNNNNNNQFIIVLGNEKGGTGKSTISIHIMNYLMYLNFKVGAIDIDARQGTLTRFIANRQQYSQNHNIKLCMPLHKALCYSNKNNTTEAYKEEEEMVKSTLEDFKECDFVIIDTPGSHKHLSNLMHSYADLLITPLNDSFVDLDVLGTLNYKTGEINSLSQYAETVWEQKKVQAMQKKDVFDWIVIRNRLSNIYAKNKEDMHNTLQKLGKRLGFRNVSGFSERVIFRELFVKGLTILDFKKINMPMTMSHIAARQELRNLIAEINLPIIHHKLANNE